MKLSLKIQLLCFLLLCPSLSFAWLDSSINLSIDRTKKNIYSPKKSLNTSSIGLKLLEIEELVHTNPEQALAKLIKLSSVDSENKTLIISVSMLSSYVKSYIELEKIPLAQKYLSELSILIKKQNITWIEATFRYLKAKLHLVNNELDEALSSANIAINKAKTVSYVDLYPSHFKLQGKTFESCH